MEKQIIELNNRLSKLEQNLNGNSNDTRQLEVIRNATKNLYSSVKLASKSATSEDQPVNEGGVALYNVLKNPDVFLEVKVGSTTYFIPAFT